MPDPLLTDADRKALSLCAGILEKVVAQIVRAHVAAALDQAADHIDGGPAAHQADADWLRARAQEVVDA